MHILHRLHRAAPPTGPAPDPRARQLGSSATDIPGDDLVVAPSQPAPGVILVRLHGEVDTLTVAHARRVLVGAIDGVASEVVRPTGDGEQVCGRVVADLSGVEFLAVGGLAMLVELAEHACAHGVELILVASCPPVRRVLELTALDRFFATAPSSSAAVASARPIQVAS